MCIVHMHLASCMCIVHVRRACCIVHVHLACASCMCIVLCPFLAFPSTLSRSHPCRTRSKHGITPFKKGAFHVALASKALVVPVALAGSDNLQSLSPPDNTIRVAFGTPLQVSGSEDVAELLSLVRSKIIDLNESIGGRGAKEGTHDAHVAQSGNPTGKKGIAAWVPDA